MRRGFDFRLLPLDILMTQQCEIENIFPHLFLTSQRDKARSNFGQQEHQTLGKNLKLMQVFNSCHI
jgi:hypothetical protein